ncbi:GNAT family N-acetyltransferase [Caminibacter pacificus]|uniref:GNAT family N-acetyltransferase n=2 Tax=Caminibacter pacificus TaxID=1424653 RepID=A0ABX5TLE9_9BACT|nr:GNAT family N-acetyltransferase [Caminibacter pacificus]
MIMEIVYNVDEYIDDLMALYKNEWWTNKRSKEEVIKMLQNSTFVFGIVENNELIAFSRVLSDKVYKAFIFDVIVRSDCRNRGLAKILMENILNHEELKNVKTFELYCKEEMIGFYEKFGFKKVEDLVLLKR